MYKNEDEPINVSCSSTALDLFVRNCKYKRTTFPVVSILWGEQHKGKVNQKCKTQ